MYHRILSMLALCVSLVAMPLTHAAPVFADGSTPKSPFSQRENLYIDNAATMVNLLCANIYPEPKSPTECIAKINAHIFKKFPDAKRKLDANVHLQKEISTDHVAESREFSVGALAVILECRGKQFRACTDKALHAIAGAFDPNTTYFNKKEANEFSRVMEGSFLGIGIHIDGLIDKNDPIVVIKPIPGSPAEEAGIKAGDHILRINGRHAITFPDMDSAINAIRGEEGTKVALTIVRNGKVLPKPLVVARRRIESTSVESAVVTYNSEHYGVILVHTFDEGVCGRIEKAFRKITDVAEFKLKGLVLSFESDLGGLLDEGHCTLDLFMDAPYFILERNRTGLHPYTPPVRLLNPLKPSEGSVSSVSSFPGDITHGLPILALGDGLSASASELVLRELQHKRRAPIAGTLTFGKGSIQNVTRLFDGMLKVTYGEFVVGSDVDYVPVQCVGVVPDIPFDRGFNPKNKKGDLARECGRNESMASAGPMQGHASHRPFTPIEIAHAQVMLEAYKKHLADNRIDEKRRLRIEKYKELQQRQKAKKLNTE